MSRSAHSNIEKDTLVNFLMTVKLSRFKGGFYSFIVLLLFGFIRFSTLVSRHTRERHH
jgi:hypothetical protein